jgi:tetratricopeptide (TPR) repeat protein
LSHPSATGRNAAIWQQEIYAGEKNNQDWAAPYQAVLAANSVLDVLKTQNIGSDKEKLRIKGRALFLRAYAFYSLVSVFSKSYESSTAESDLGIPLKLDPAVEEVVSRSTVQETYDKIISDMTDAGELLNQDVIEAKKNQPSKAAVFAFLARVYLSMRKYDLAEKFAGQSLALFSALTDFNTLSTTSASAFTANSQETIYFSRGAGSGSSFWSSTYGVDPNLINLYSQNDLRLKIYFTNATGIYKVKTINARRGSAPFSGLATDEVLLIKAECLARRGQVSEAIDILNTLKKTRIKTGFYTPEVATDQSEALEKVLIERRRALVWRTLRWTDIKRLNLEGRNIVLTRKLDDKVFTLEPNSAKYVLPIPDDEVALSGIQQNIR